MCISTPCTSPHVGSVHRLCCPCGTDCDVIAGQLPTASLKLPAHAAPGAVCCVLCAAARAIESMRADALFIDPFAKLLAGPKAMARHQVRPGWEWK